MLDFLPSRLMRAVEHVNLHRLYELRVRADKPLRANIGGREVYLGVHGETASADDALYPTAEELSDIVFAASEYSVYAASEQIKRGYVTAAHGERIGLAGTYVCDRDGTLTIRSYTSLCIRVPHAVQGCAEEIYTRCLRDGMRLILSELEKAFTAEGITRMDVLDKPYDPNTQEVVAMIPSSAEQAGLVLQEVQMGFMMDGNVLRPARVIVGQESED